MLFRSNDGDGASASRFHLRDGLVDGLVIDIAAHECGAFIGEGETNGAADAATRAGDDGDLALQSP